MIEGQPSHEESWSNATPQPELLKGTCKEKIHRIGKEEKEVGGEEEEALEPHSERETYG